MVEQVIGAEQFDEEGRLSVELPFSVYNSPGVEFLVFANEGCRLNVRGISCRKTPE